MFPSTSAEVPAPLPVHSESTLPANPLLWSKRRKTGHSSFKRDRLGKIVVQSILAYRRLVSWPRYAQKARGRKRLSRRVKRLRHRAATYLERLRRQGAQAKVSGPPWSLEHLERCIARGPHKSAKDEADFVRNEMADFCDKGFYTVLPFDMVQDLPNLRLSPLGVVPQRNRWNGLRLLQPSNRPLVCQCRLALWNRFHLHPARHRWPATLRRQCYQPFGPCRHLRLMSQRSRYLTH